MQKESKILFKNILIHHQYKIQDHLKMLGNGDLIARKIIYSVLGLSAY